MILVFLLWTGIASSYTFQGYELFGGTWHVADKTYVGDSSMCWAAAESNVLAWAGWGARSAMTKPRFFATLLTTGLYRSRNGFPTGKTLFWQP